MTNTANTAFTVSASHVAADYRVDSVVFALNDFEPGHGRLGGDETHGYHATLARFGQGRTCATPRDAIRDLLLSNGCTAIRIEPLAAELSYGQRVDALKSADQFREAGALAFANGRTRDSYGPHFGMRSTREWAVREFAAGFDNAAFAARRDARLDTVAPLAADPAPQGFTYDPTRVHVAPKLPFDFRILAVAWFNVRPGTIDSDESVILIRRTAPTMGDFVTYRMDSRGNCHGGHYDMTAEQAASDYAERAARYQARMVAALNEATA